MAVFAQRHENGMANIHPPSACERQIISHMPDESRYNPGGGLARIRRGNGFYALCINYRPARLLVDTSHVPQRKGDELAGFPRGGAAASSGKSEVQRETSSWDIRTARMTKPVGFILQIREAQHMAWNSTNTAPCHIACIYKNAIPELGQRHVERPKTR